LLNILNGESSSSFASGGFFLSELNMFEILFDILFLADMTFGLGKVLEFVP